jgi:ribosome-associated heat shock protein Hsp15
MATKASWDDGPVPDSPEDAMRVDKWLWVARLARTRPLAAEAVTGGRVEVNGARVKPSRDVRAGDELRLTTGPVPRTVVVRGVAPRRGPASAAALLYEETPESAAERERAAELRRLTAPRDVAGGRPTKRERRRMDAGRRDRGR